MSIAKFHAEWLSLIEISGPFLSLPVLKKMFPQGLDAHDSDHFRVLRQVHEEWDDNQQGLKPDPATHTQWIKWVLRNTLELEEVLVEGQEIPQTLKTEIEEPQHRETLRPDMVVMGPDNKARMLIQMYPLNQKLGRTVEGKPWKASPDTRMTQLLRDSGVPLGLITNGDQWMVVYAPQGETSGYASWYSTLWLEEQKTLAAFRTLLSLHRFFGVPDDETLVPMLAESASTQQEVTDQLGSQVRSAVEILIQSLDRADQDYGRELLADVPEEVLYEAALTVMMRLVFLFCAEERELLLLGDQLFDQHYAVSTLVAQLQNTADQHGEEILERRLDAWCRLLSTFRAVYGGVNHDRMHLPAYSGNLFDPDRFPFLEGRKSDTSWKDTEANPLPINNRTVLHLLRSLQYLEMHDEAQRLSFRALDIEQIGHVYEGLLDHTAKRSTEPVLGLVGKHEPETPLAQLEEQRAKGNDDFFDFLKKETGSGRKWENYIDQELDTEASNRLRSACGNDEDLFERVLPYAKLVRNDTFDRPVVIRKNSFYVTAGTDRRSSGTHYTPRSLTEPIVKHTLEPLVYEGPAEGKPREEWKLKSPEELLDLKICDMACGSGAFLVQAARYMAERLLESWEAVVKESTGESKITPFGEPSTGNADEQLIPDDSHERVIYARRIVAQRCLYGVDVNPLATDMAKLSLWLLTLAKDKPFTFLDHSIRCGDSLVGISSIDQLECFSLNGDGSQRSFAQEQIKRRIEAAKLLRQQLERMPTNNVADISRKAEMLNRAEEQAGRLRYAADMMFSVYWRSLPDTERSAVLQDTLMDVEFRFKDLPVRQLEKEASTQLRSVNCPDPFHWAIEFPEVFDEGGIHAFVCNPPFMGGTKLEPAFGRTYREYLVGSIAGGIRGVRGTADLCCYFLRRSAQLTVANGHTGMLTTNTIAEGDSREVGLQALSQQGRSIIRAEKSRKWPGTANLEISSVWLRNGSWQGGFVLGDQVVDGITPFLDVPGTVTGKPYALAANEGKCIEGAKALGMGFILDPSEAEALIEKDERNRDALFPFLTGQDLNTSPTQHARRWTVFFADWPLSHATAPSNYGGPVAEDYPDCLDVVEEKVKPERLAYPPDSSWNRSIRDKWWQYGLPRPALLEATRGLDRVLVRSAVSNINSFAFAPTSFVFSHATKVFIFDDYGSFSVLQSCVHAAWLERYASSMRTDVRYTPKSCFSPFPFPNDPTQLVETGSTYYAARQSIMADNQQGLTKTYNRMFDPDESSEEIRVLRERQVNMDQSVAAAYGWDDLDLGHDFHKTKHGFRYTISDAARHEILQRLLKLNHERYEEEVKQGLHNKRGKKKKSKVTPKRKKKAAAQAATLFPDED
ncbi:restriction endonuclease [Rhodopirellula sp. SM50]|nr:N-6 DNA methylase [Rhodopirellula sp. SM50]PAY17448.1 restriction endonuclease [Rhodopirellula sp. SM50]